MPFLQQLFGRRAGQRKDRKPHSTTNHIQPNRKAEQMNDERFMNVSERGKLAASKFPDVPPLDVPPAVKIREEKYNHACMEHGWVEFDLGRGLDKGDTGAMFGDDFCLVHGITRVFVLDPDNHVAALVSPLRYMMYQAYRMYSVNPPNGNIFTFANRAAAPRWAMRAAANQILAGQNCGMQRQGTHFTLTGVELNKSGNNATEQQVFERVPYTSISWAVMDKWLEQARSHFVSYVVADTRLSVEHDTAKCLPLCVREDESDLIMADLVENIVDQDQRYTEIPVYSKDTLAFQFRGGWYAPKTENGLTRIQRAAVQYKDGTWAHTKAYSNKFIANPSKDLWYIGGIHDVQCPAHSRFVGDHREFQGINFESGGLQNEKKA